MVKGHGFDVEGAQDSFLVHQVGVIADGVSGRQDDAHTTHVDVDCPQVRPVQWRALSHGGRISRCVAPTIQCHNTILRHSIPHYTTVPNCANYITPHTINASTTQHNATDSEDGNLGEVTNVLPLLPDVLLVSHQYHVPQFLFLEVARPQRHDEVAQADDCRVGVCEQTHHHVVCHHRHRCLLSCLCVYV